MEYVMNATPASPSYLTRRELSKMFIGSSIGGVLPGVGTRDDQHIVWPTAQGNAARTGYCHSDESAEIDGGVVWEAEVSAKIKTPAVVSNGAVVVATTDGLVAAFNLKNGEKRWEHNGTAGIERSPTVDHDTVYVYLEEGWMHALDLRTGETRWRTDLKNDLHGVSSSAIVDGVLYIGSGVTYAIDAASGEIHWKVVSDTGNPTGLAVNDGRVFMGSTGTAEALNAEDGRQLWKAEIETRIWGLATIGGDVYYSYGPPNVVAAFSRETGNRRWLFSITEEPHDVIVAGPIVIGDTIVAVDRNNNVAAADRADGSVRWRYSVDGKLDHHPVACQDRVYLPTDKGVVALSMSTGNVQWRTEVGELPTSPAIASDRLIVTTRNGRVLALGAEQRLLDRWGTELGAGAAGLIGLGGYGVYRYLQSRQTDLQN